LYCLKLGYLGHLFSPVSYDQVTVKVIIQISKLFATLF
jgi:hypothetical protein